MRVDSANRSFAALFGASLMAGMFILCGAVGCVLIGLLVSEVTSDGIGSPRREPVRDARDAHPAETRPKRQPLVHPR